MYQIRILIFVIVLLPVLIGLGVWQYGRYQEKLALEEQHHLRRQTVFSVADIQKLDDPRYYSISLSGQFDNQHSFLLDNRIFNGRVGFHVISPFETSDGQWVLIDRGWISGSPDRSQLPSILPVDGLVLTTGQSWLPAGDAFLLKQDQWQDKWPKVIQSIDLKRMATEAGQPLLNWLLVLDQHQPGSFQRNFHIVNMPPSRHLGYAVQWFLMALVLTLLGGYAIFRSCRFSKNDFQKKSAEQEL